MRLARSWSVALQGMKAELIEVEVSFGAGLPRTILVGLGDAAVQEARERCRSAVGACHLPWPTTSLTINLSPADIPKAGSHFDLAIVTAILAASDVVPAGALESTVFMGELGLDGKVRPVRGVLASLLGARRQGVARAVVPVGQVREARLVEGLAVVGVSRLDEVVSLLRGQPIPEPPPEAVPAPEHRAVRDMADVVGQGEGRWALEVAAAGGHHLAMVGPPGVGKTLLAERLPGVLPDLTSAESLEVSAIHSLVGAPLDHLLVRPPYADPHHTASQAALVGGGSRFALPGAVSKAHRGVLFLDEAPEFSPRALESLRTPLERGEVVHMRSQGQVTYPARFQLVLASNPCPCGWYGTRGGKDCTCAPMAIRRYRERLSGPILDRIDIHLQLRPLEGSSLRIAQSGEPSAAVAERVLAARERQRRRLADFRAGTNAEVSGAVLRTQLRAPKGEEIVERALRLGQLSVRGVVKVLRLAWTLADLGGHDAPTRADVRTALGMRLGELEEVRSVRRA